MLFNVGFNDVDGLKKRRHAMIYKNLVDMVIHTSDVCKESGFRIKKSRLWVVNWPAQSLGLNSLKHVCHKVKRQIEPIIILNRCSTLRKVLVQKKLRKLLVTSLSD